MNKMLQKSFLIWMNFPACCYSHWDVEERARSCFHLIHPPWEDYKILSVRNGKAREASCSRLHDQRKWAVFLEVTVMLPPTLTTFRLGIVVEMSRCWVHSLLGELFPQKEPHSCHFFKTLFWFSCHHLTDVLCMQIVPRPSLILHPFSFRASLGAPSAFSLVV